jgi:hypothetical protein
MRNATLNVPIAALTCVGLVTTSCLAQCEPERIVSPSAEARDFGFGVGMTERHLIVGDRHDWSLCPTNPECSNGWAHAYRRTPDGGWEWAQDLVPASLAPGFAFGSAVVLDGDRAIVTASLSTAGPGLGVPYVFDFDGERWVETGALFPPDARGIHGERLALHGDTAIVGKAGSRVLVYHKQGDDWAVTHDLFNEDAIGTRSDFGWGFDLNDEWIVIGSPLERTIAGNGGAAYVYERLSGGDLRLVQKLLAPDVLEGPRFGYSVAIDGDTLAIGGINSDSPATAQGAVYIYERNDGHLQTDGPWRLAQTVTHADGGPGDQLGVSLALSGDLLAVGSIRVRTAMSGGAAYLFQRGIDGRWQQVADLLPAELRVEFGYRMAMADGMVAIGAADTPIDGLDRGAVDIFDLSCFVCVADLDLDGTLTIFDFLAFANLFQDGDAQADFDGDGELTIFDFLAFQTAFDAGC